MRLKYNNFMRYRSSANILPAIFLVTAMASAWTQTQAATATATVDANIIMAISMTTRNGLSFGDISAGSTSGTVILTPSGARTATGGTTVNTSTSGNPSTFDVQGEPNASFSITLPVSVILSNSSSQTMTVDNFTSSPSPSGVLDSSGKQTLFVGATLNVSANQPFGSYSGQMSVTVDYN
ncbi:MAG: DUF4402 domain-containing protein [Gammaproteobacteria bacterium]|nr:DUF4402 domain-containing protein [Gammaproteobacteria bacterium]